MKRFNQTMKSLSATLALLVLCIQLNAALITWDTANAVDSDWNNAANWEGGVVPGPADDAVISGSANSVVISTTATVQSVELKSGADLTIDAGAVLTLGNDTGSTTNGAFDLDSTSSTVINNGSIIITNAAEQGMAVKGTLINNGSISIDGAATDGIEIRASGSFFNNAGATLTITNVGDDHLAVDDGTTGGVLLPGSFVNEGTIDIIMNGGDEAILVNDLSTFDNTATGVINIVISDGNDGIVVEGGSIFNNFGAIDISSTSPDGDNNGLSIKETGTEFNNIGTLIVMGTNNDAIAIQSGATFNNAGETTVIDSGDHGVDVSGTWINSGTYTDINSDGDALRVNGSGVAINTGTLILDITSATSDAIEVQSGGSFTNAGIIETGIGSTTNEFEIRDDVDLGPGTVILDIAGTSEGSNEFDQIQIANGVLTLSSTNLELDWGTYIPNVGDCFPIVESVNGSDGSVGTIAGEFATITGSNPLIVYDVTYNSADALVELCVTAVFEEAACEGNVAIENLPNGMDYVIVSGPDGTVEVTATVVDNPAGLVAFFGGAGNPISFPDAAGTFTFNFPGQTVGDLFLTDIFFNWAGNAGNSETLASIVGNCPGPTDLATCDGNVPIENLASGMDYTIVTAEDGTVDVTVTVVDNPVGLVAFYGGAGNPISFPDANGTFTYNFPTQTIGDAFIVDIFFNWAGNAGNSETIGIVVGGDCFLPNTDVVFCVDVSCLTNAPTNPSVFGNFSTPVFDVNQNLLVDNGAGLLCATVSIAPGSYEYLFFDGANAEVFEPGAPCTTTNFGFTNRVLEVGSTSPQMETFGWASCDATCFQPLPAPDLPITFDDEGIDYNLGDFGGTSSVIGVDPTDATNDVLCITKPPGSQCWAGTTVGTSCLENPIPFTADNQVITIDVYSPTAGTPMLLKVEACGNAAISSEIIVLTTAVNTWETLVFDLSMGCPNPIDLANEYQVVSIFPQFVCDPDACGVPNPGIAAPFVNESYYFDNIMFCDQSVAPEIVCPADVTVACDGSIDPADTGMATATDLCGEPVVTFADVSTQGADCSAYSYTITRTWTATDAVGITAVCDQIITVVDLVAPVIVCPADVGGACTISTDPADTGVATATDNCSADAEITITSSDVSTQAVVGCEQFTFTILRTWFAEDICGNIDSCVQTINIADSEGPVIACPADQMLDCSATPGPIAYTIDDFMAIGGTASDNCSSLSELTLSVIDNPIDQTVLNTCPGSSEADRTLTRTYTITDACGNVSTCQQLFIYAASTSDPVITETPADQTVDCAVNAIPQLFAFVAEGDCADITYTVSGPSSAGIAGCNGSTIQYTYTATDGCGRDISHIQTYTLANDGPEFVCPADICIIECPADTDMIQAQFDAYASLATVISSCSETSISIGNNFNPNGFISQNCANPTVAVEGAIAYQVVSFTATDACGRNSVCTAFVVIKDSDGPMVDSEVSFGLADCNDADLQGGYTAWATNQLNGLSATDECSNGAISFSYSPLAANVDCSNGPATTEVSFIATDACGNETILAALYQITNDGSGEPMMATVAGSLVTEEDEVVALASVEVDGFMNNEMTTTTDGYYHFDLPMAQNYTISPSRNDDPLNGITTYDLILLGRHLLEITTLDSPYKLIAADVNESGHISAIDMIELRRLILNIDAEFSSGKSWTFVDASYEFPQPTNPFATTFPTAANINNLVSSQVIDFVGVKLGDLNASANATSLQAGDTRSSDGSLNIKLEDQQLEAGQQYDLAFKASDFKDVAGFQFTLDFATEYLELVDFEGSELNSMSANNFGFTKANEGKITVSWNENQAIDMTDDATLFTLSFTASKAVQLSQVLEFSSSVTASEAYQADLLKNVVLDFGNMISTGKEFALLQNQPNPFSQETVIGFQLPEATDATLTIFDVAGRVVSTQTNAYDAGAHQVMMNKADLGATGVFYYQLSTGKQTATKKMIVLK